MNKIIVTTDFSANSKKGIHFAMQLASQTDCELIFYNVIEIFRPSIWDNIYYAEYEADQIKQNQKALETFIHNIYQKSNYTKTNYKCVCQVGIKAGNQIIEYAKEINADYICVSTIGAGKLIQLFGTIASELISFSPTPVFIVPKNYKSKPISTIIFESDFKNFEYELNKVKKVSTPLKAKISVLHYDYLVHLNQNKNKTDKLISKFETDSVKFHLKELDPIYPLRMHLQKDIEKMRPSLLVLFTRQNRNWFNRLFISSLSAEMAFDTKTPMLIFRKHIK